MVSSVSSANNINYNNVEFVKKALKYTQGQPIKEQSAGQEVASGLPTSIAYASAFQIIPATNKAIKFKNLKNVIGKDEFKRVWTGTVENAETLEAVKGFAAENPKKFTSLSKRLKNIIFKKPAEQVAQEAAIKATGKATSNVEALASSAKLLSKAGIKSIFKQAKSYFVFNMAFQLFDIIPAFKEGGVSEGIKQVGKSAVHAAGDAIAYSAGLKIGAAIGGAVSMGNPIGALIGGALGMVIGGVTSSLVGKGITKVLGKSYKEQQAEAQEQQVAETIADNPQAMNQLKQAVEEKIAQDTQSGKKKAIKQAAIMQEELQNMPVQETSYAANDITFSASDSTKNVNNSVRLSQAAQQYVQNNGTTTAPQQQEQQGQQPVQVQTPANLNAITRSVMTGLDSSKFQAIA